MGKSYNIPTKLSTLFILVGQLRNKITRYPCRIVISFDRKLRDMAKKKGNIIEKSGSPQLYRPIKDQELTKRVPILGSTMYTSKIKI